MILSQFRPVLGPAVISMSVLFAADAYFVRPMRQKLNEARRQTSAAIHQGVEVEALNASLPDLQRRLEVAERKLARIRTAGDIVRDQGLLFQRIWDIGKSVGVSVEVIDPQTSATRAGREGGTEALRCAIEAIGSYGSVALFVHDLEAELGLTFVRSVHIVPKQDGNVQAVLASIETEHLAIDVRAERE
ncbi:MAG: hypothetical protein IIB55_03670 [Planctomycetes bacterium]|nr:hypothetical protein [Planctomycetota bacterium]